MSANWSVQDDIRKEQRAALKGMSPKQKIAYFWQYYWLQTVIAVASALIVISIISSMASNKPYSFYAMMINSYTLDSNQMSTDFSAYAGLDNEDYNCFIETDVVMEGEDFGQHAYAIVQRIMAMIMGGELDVFVSDGITFVGNAHNEIFIDLRYVFDAAELSAYEGNIFYIDQAVIDAQNDSAIEQMVEEALHSPAPAITNADLSAYREPWAIEQMQEPIPIGIFVGDSPLLTESGAFPTGMPVFGIIGNSQRIPVARQFLWYLMGEE